MKRQPDDNKLRGGYYTPPTVARFLAEWAIRDANDAVLEPSCGDGELALVAAQRLKALSGPQSGSVTAVEFERTEALVASARLHDAGVDDSVDVCVGDFFAFAQESLAAGRMYDVVLGNPPYIRYQTFPEEHRTIALQLMVEVGMKPSRMTNAWAAFVVAAMRVLREGGRFAMVLPAELLQVNYAAQIREYMAREFGRVDLIAFDKLVFEGIQQEVVLLLAEKNRADEHSISVTVLSDATPLRTSPAEVLRASAPKPLLAESEKWTKYFLDRRDIELLRELRAHPGIRLSGDYLDIDVGVVTGENSFFVVDAATIEKYDLADYCRPLAGRSAQLAGLDFTSSDWHDLAASGVRNSLLHIAVPVQPNSGVSKYIALGEERGVHLGYKCRIRKEWYVVPSVWEPDGFMLRQVAACPRVVSNSAGATCTDTLHRVRLVGPASMRQAATGFLNSLTLAFGEVTGRAYGGGVLTFEPSEAERLPVPALELCTVDFERADMTIRDGQLAELIGEVDKQLLRGELGLTASECSQLGAIWERLRDRRLTRKRSVGRKTS